MNADSLGELVSDIRALQQENRRLRRSGFVVVVLLSIFFLSAAWPGDQAKTVESEQFVLRTSKGAVSAKLYTAEDGFPKLDFYDESGRVRIELGLGMDGQGGHGLMICEANKEGGAIVLDVSRFGSSNLEVRAQDGKTIMLTASKKPDDFAEISLGSTERNQIEISARSDGCGIDLFARQP